MKNDNNKADNTIKPQSIGRPKKELDENTSSAAYHKPEGFLLRYGPNLKAISEDCFSDKNQIRTDKIKSLIELTLHLN